MRDAEMVDHLTYRSYWAQRKLYGISAERCALLFVEHEALETKYLKEENVSN